MVETEIGTGDLHAQIGALILCKNEDDYLTPYMSSYYLRKGQFGPSGLKMTSSRMLIQPLSHARGVASTIYASHRIVAPCLTTAPFLLYRGIELFEPPCLHRASKNSRQDSQNNVVGRFWLAMPAT